MKFFPKKFFKKKAPIIIGAILALVASVIIVGAIENSLSGGSAIKVVSAKSVFQSDETPQFIFVYEKQASIFNRLFSGITGLFNREVREITATVKVVNAKGDEVEGLDPQIKQESGGEFSVDLERSGFQQELRPGKYKMKFEIKDGDRIYLQEQEFVWGVLTINTNKSIYLPGENVYLQIAALKDDGHTVCNADLKLEITVPGNGVVYPEIKRSGKCRQDNVVDVPDYFAYYKVEKEGKYKMKLTNLNNDYSIEDYFEVKESVLFEVERIGPTRIWPQAEYEMKIKIKTKADFKGEIVETIPASFEIKDKSQNAEIRNADGNIKFIVWQGRMLANKTYDFEYTFDAPDVSPYLYVLGPLEMKTKTEILFKEVRTWKIAADGLTDGMAATDVLGQLTATDAAIFTKCGANNYPSTRGIDSPNGIVIDTTNHRSFVVDRVAGRVLVYNLDANNNLIDRVADNVLGQADFDSSNTTCNSSTMYGPEGVVYDSANNYLFVADYSHYRVLVYDVSSIIDGEAAIKVLGKANFTDCVTSSCTSSNIYKPYGLAYESGNKKLFVADGSNNRVTVYDLSGGITNGMAASNVLGQANMTSCASTTCNSSTTYSPFGVAYDSANHYLFVGDALHYRVLVYDVTAITDGEAAIKVLGQANMTSCASTTCDSSTTQLPYGVAYDSGNSYLYVADYSHNRVLVYDVTAITDGEAAIKVLGQANMTSCASTTCDSSTTYNPTYVAYDSGNTRLYVADYNHDRILIYDVSSITDGEAATDVLGQLTATDAAIFTKCGAGNFPSNRGLNYSQGVVIDTTNHRLFVADSANNRVLVYNLDANNNLIDRVADNVLGQADFDSSNTTCNSSTMYGPRGLDYNSANNYLFVADYSHYRVLVYDVTAITDGEAAIKVLGQANMTTCNSTTCGSSTTQYPDDVAYDSGKSYLYVSDFSHYRVLVYDVAAITDGEAAIKVLGQANMTTCTSTTCNSSTTYGPRGLAYDSGNSYLYVSDFNHYRVLVYDVTAITDGEAAIKVLGQANMTTCNSTTCNSSTTYEPRGLAHDSVNSRLFVADQSHNRVLIYDVAAITDGEAAINVLGKANFTDCSTNTCDSLKLSAPYALAYDIGNTRLYVADYSHHRLQVYDFDEGVFANEPIDIIFRSNIKIRGPARIKTAP